MQHNYVAGKSLIFSRPIQCSEKPRVAGIRRLEERNWNGQHLLIFLKSFFEKFSQFQIQFFQNNLFL